jgi:murein DD-endopeptidase MepM/ murein hydrolase activator NlpD
MRKVVLGAWILALTFAVAFYFGRHSVEIKAVTPTDQSRARIREADLPKPLPQPPPVPSSSSGDLTSTVVDTRDLTERKLTLPIERLRIEDIQDTFDETRDGTRRHEATDILAPPGTPVLAVDNGIIQKLFLSKPGGLTIYLFDNAGKYSYYYAHLDRYVEGLAEGMHVKKGERIGYVGSTGNANPKTPHLHLAIFLLGADKKWWQGTPINPYPILIKTLRDQ